LNNLSQTTQAFEVRYPYGAPKYQKVVLDFLAHQKNALNLSKEVLTCSLSLIDLKTLTVVS
jgi:hypothetical protein